MRRVFCVVLSAFLSAGLLSAPYAAVADEPSPPPATEGWSRSTHWKRLPDGRVKVTAYPAPAFARRGQSWIPLDARVRDSGDARSPFAAPDALVPIRFGTTANRVVELELAKGPVRLTAPGLTIGTPEREGNVVRYRDVATDTDLEIEVTAHGLRTRFVLRSEQAPRSFDLRLADPNDQLGDVRTTAGDGYEFTKKVDGDLTLKMSPGFAYEESAAAGGAPAGVEPGSAHLAVRKDGNDFVLAKSVDAGWLQGKKFPIVLDPDVWLEGTGAMTDCHLVSGSRIDTNYCNSTSFEVGYHAADTMIRRVLLNFDLPTMPEGSTVDASSPTLWLVTNVTPTATTTAPTYDVYEVSTSWTTDVTWRRRNATTNWTTAGGTWFAGARGSAVMERGVGDATAIAINTAMIQKWATNPPTNNGMIVRARSESTQTMLRFGSSEHAEQAQWPLLTYSYTEAPSAPSSITVLPGRAKALVSWGAADPGDEAIAKYRIRAICASSGCPAETQVYECSASCRTQEVTVAGGHYYTFEVRAQDMSGRNGAAATSGATFVRSNLAPLVPDNLSPPTNSKLRQYPNECGRYRDPEADPGTIVVDITDPSGTAVATGVRSVLLTDGSVGCVSPNLPEGHYRWSAVAMDDALLTSPRTAVQSFLIDNSPPAPPVISSSTHPDQNGWYRTSSVTLSIAQQDDISGIDGFSWHHDTTPGVLPNETIDLTGTSLTQTFADGERYLHFRSCNGVALCSAGQDFRVRIDTVTPNVPTITSSTHTPGAWSNVREAQVNWSVPFDATSGIAGYRTAWNKQATFTPTTTNVFTTRSTSPVMDDGDWYFHLAAVDRAGNVSNVVTRGPFKIDGVLPGAPTLSSTTHPSQTQWSTVGTATMTWSATDPSGVVAYSYALDQDPTSTPDVNPDTSTTTATVSVPDGVNYFHVRALDGAGNWGPTTTYTLLVDATAPVISSVTSSTHPDPEKWYTTASPALSWAASDVSGITGYSYVFDQSPTTVPDNVSEGTATSRTFGPVTADGTYYLHVRPINGSGLIGAVTHRKVLVDLTAPGSTTVSSAHSSAEWSALDDVTFNWTQVSDLSGVPGYAVVLDQSATTVPSTATALTTVTTKTFNDLADGIWYVHVRPVNGAGLWGATSHYKVQLDKTPAAMTSLASSTHPDFTKWYSADDVTVTYGASDLSGIAGYSVSIDGFATGSPGTSVNTVSTQHTFPDVADGVSWVHVRAINGSNLPGPVSTHKVLIDDTAPTAVTVVSPDHPAGMTTNQRVVTLDWAAAPGSDATSGIAGYHVSFTNSATPVAASSITTTNTSFTSAALGDGTWYAHVRAVDNAFNPGIVTVFGPIHIDPNAPPVSDAERDRFVAAWKPRVTSETFGPQYLQSPGYSPEILAEGFHGYNPIQKGYLVDQLWAILRAENPPPPEVEITEQAARDELYDFVFAKEKFLVEKPPTEVVDNTVRAVLPEVPVLSPRLDALDLGRGIDLKLPDLPAVDLPDLGVEEVVADLEDTLEPVTQDATAVLSEETNAALGALQNNLLDTLDTVTSEVDKVLADTVGLDTSAVFNLVNALPVDAAYQVCFETRTRKGCQNVALIGLPGPVDLSGDGTPDVTAQFAPALNAGNAVGVGFSLDVRRAPTPHDLEGEALEAHVWVVYDVPLYNARFRIGFNGLTNDGQLSEATALNLTMKDPTRLAQRDFLTNYAIQHTSPSSRPWALTMGMQNITGDPDPTTARIEFAPPANSTGDLDLVNDDTESARNRDIKFTARVDHDDVKLTIAAHETVAARNEVTDVTATLDTMPRETSLTLHDEVPDSDSRDLKIDVRNNARTGRISANVRVVRGTQRTNLYADLRDVPSTVSYHLTNEGGDGHHVYTANGNLGSISAAAELIDNGVRKGTATVRAGTVPVWLDLRHTPDPNNRELILVDYTAAGSMPRLDATGFYRPELLTVKLSAKDVPALLTGEVDTKFRHVSFDTPTPITLLDATVTRKTTRVSRLAGEHATIVTPASGQFGLSARVSGLTSATFDMGDVLIAETTVVPGSQKFLVGGQIGTVFFSGEVSNLPSTMRLVLDRINLRIEYRGSAVVPKLRGYAGARPGGPHVEATLSKVPTQVTLTVTPGASKGTLTYDASAPLGSIDRFVATSDGTVGDKSGTTVQGTIKDLPRTATLTADRSLKSFAFSGDQPVGDLDVTMSRNGARPQRAAQNHLTMSGTTTAWALGVHIGSVRSATLDMTQGLSRSSAEVKLGTAGQQFVVNGNLDGVRLYANVSNLPTSFGYVANGTASLHYETSAPISKLVVYVAKTGTGPTMRGQITGTPLSGTVTSSMQSPRYSLSFDGSGPMTGASGFYSSRYVDAAAQATTDFVSGSVKGLPTWFTTVVDTSTKQITFTSNRGMDEVTAKAKGLFVNNLQAEAVLRDLPANAHVHFALNDLLFDPYGGQIGYAFARGSNYQTPPKRMAGRHVFLRADLPRALFDASAELTNISGITVKRNGSDIGIEGNVDIGTAKLGLDLHADFYGPGTTDHAVRAAVRGSVVGFPSDLTVSRTGETVEYHADRNLSADLTVGIGYPIAVNRAATPKPRYGVSVTDSVCTPGEGCPTKRVDGSDRIFCQSAKNQCLGFRARINYEGLPKDITLRLDAVNDVFVTTSALASTKTTFSVLADLDWFTPWPILADLTLDGVLPGTTLDVGPVRFGKTPSGGANVFAAVHSNRDLGAMAYRVEAGVVLDFGNFRYRDFVASGHFWKVPKDFTADVTIGYQTRVVLTSSTAIPGEAVTMRASAHVQRKGASGAFETIKSRAEAVVNLFDVPATVDKPVDLTVRFPNTNPKGSPIVMPGMSYTSQDNGLDGAITADPQWGHLLLFDNKLDSDLKRIAIDFDDLSSKFDVNVNPSSFEVDVAAGVDAQPARRFVARLDGLDVDADADTSFDKKKPGVRLIADIDFDIHIAADTVDIEMLGVRSLHVRPGKWLKLAFGIDGDYGTFRVNVAKPDFDISAQATLRVRPWPEWVWSKDVFAIKVPRLGPISVNQFVSHVNDADRWGSVGPCYRSGWGPMLVSAEFEIKPAPTDNRQKNGVTIVGDGTRKVFTFADPDYPEWRWILATLIDVVLVAGLEDPYGDGGWRIDMNYGWECT